MKGHNGHDDSFNMGINSGHKKSRLKAAFRIQQLAITPQMGDAKRWFRYGQGLSR